jgi:5-methyltetrahydrofolate--homocysteine methyltransferase
MAEISKLLSSGKVLVSDGATGTSLFSKGLDSGDSPERWNLTHPEQVADVAVSFAEAGSDIVHTNTFGGSVLKLGDFGLGEQVAGINGAAVSAIRKALGHDILIAGSVGPTGKMLQPYGEVAPEEMENSFARQIEALINAGVDLLNIETMTSLDEALLALQAARDIDRVIPVIVSMTYDKTPNGFFTIMGNELGAATRSLEEHGADIIGSNCGNGLSVMIEIAAAFKQATSLPLLIQSNAGIPEYRGGKLSFPETPEYFQDKMDALLGTGVSIVGGCCGTTPEHIRVIRAAVDAWNSR